MTTSLRVLIVAMEPSLREYTLSQLKNSSPTVVADIDDYLSRYDSWGPEAFDVVMCGVGWDGLNAKELAQSLKMRFPQRPLLFIGLDSQVQENAVLVKNGFAECYYYPMDVNLLGLTLHDLERKITGETLARHVAVSAFDLEPSKELDFEVNIYLPANNRYVRMNKRGGTLSEKQLKKLADNAIVNVYVTEDQLSSYHKFISNRIRESASDPQTVTASVRRLFQDLLSPREAQFEDGKSYLSHAQQIIAEYVGLPEAFCLHKALLKTLGSPHEGLYEKSQKVATICGLIALGTGNPRPEDLVMAALFCDLSLSQLPGGSAASAFGSSDELKLLHSHPARSLQILTQKRMIILPEVREIILQHHERADGKGFPECPLPHKISEEAQLLLFAGQLEEMTRTRAGCPRVSLDVAYRTIAANGSIRADIANKLRPIFLPTQSGDFTFA